MKTKYLIYENLDSLPLHSIPVGLPVGWGSAALRVCCSSPPPTPFKNSCIYPFGHPKSSGIRHLSFVCPSGKGREGEVAACQRMCPLSSGPWSAWCVLGTPRGRRKSCHLWVFLMDFPSVFSDSSFNDFSGLDKKKNWDSTELYCFCYNLCHVNFQSMEMHFRGLDGERLEFRDINGWKINSFQIQDKPIWDSLASQVSVLMRSLESWVSLLHFFILPTSLPPVLGLWRVFLSPTISWEWRRGTLCDRNACSPLWAQETIVAAAL